jgi:hypothetical protein
LRKCAASAPSSALAAEQIALERTRLLDGRAASVPFRARSSVTVTLSGRATENLSTQIGKEK